MRRFHIAFVLLLLLVPVGRAEAAPIFFDFTLEFTSGSLVGNSYQGSLSVDGADCTGIGGTCTGTFTEAGPLNLLSFDVTVDGHAFSLANETAPAQVFLFNDTIVNLFYVGVDGLSSLGIFSANDVIFSSDVNVAVGSLIGGGRQASVVPEPASMLLLGLGLTGAGVRRWRQQRP